MNFSFKIVEETHGKRGYAYSVLIEGESKSEFRKFMENSDYNQRHDFYRLISKLHGLCEKTGFGNPGFFKVESQLLNNVEALYEGTLRLFCCRFPNVLLILGSGGIKKTRTYQDTPSLKAAGEIMEYVYERFSKRIREKEISFDNTGKLNGNLYFEKE